MKLFKVTYKSSFGYISGKERNEKFRGSYTQCVKKAKEVKHMFNDIKIEEV